MTLDTPHFNMAIPGGSYMMAAGFFNWDAKLSQNVN